MEPSIELIQQSLDRNLRDFESRLQVDVQNELKSFKTELAFKTLKYGLSALFMNFIAIIAFVCSLAFEWPYSIREIANHAAEGIAKTYVDVKLADIDNRLADISNTKLTENLLSRVAQANDDVNKLVADSKATQEKASALKRELSTAQSALENAKEIAPAVLGTDGVKLIDKIKTVLRLTESSTGITTLAGFAKRLDDLDSNSIPALGKRIDALAQLAKTHAESVAAADKLLENRLKQLETKTVSNNLKCSRLDIVDSSGKSLIVLGSTTNNKGILELFGSPDNRSVVLSAGDNGGFLRFYNSDKNPIVFMGAGTNGGGIAEWSSKSGSTMATITQGTEGGSVQLNNSKKFEIARIGVASDSTGAMWLRSDSGKLKAHAGNRFTVYSGIDKVAAQFGVTDSGNGFAEINTSKGFKRIFLGCESGGLFEINNNSGTQIASIHSNSEGDGTALFCSKAGNTRLTINTGGTGTNMFFYNDKKAKIISIGASTSGAGGLWISDVDGNLKNQY